MGLIALRKRFLPSVILGAFVVIVLAGCNDMTCQSCSEARAAATPSRLSIVVCASEEPEVVEEVGEGDCVPVAVRYRLVTEE